MAFININLKGKYTLKCLKVIVFAIIVPSMIFTFYVIIFQTEKIEKISKLFYNPIIGSG